MKAGKIIRNTVLGALGLVLVLLVTLQIVLRPAVLTGIVNKIAADYVEGDVSFREVKAHVIKSFPYLHLEAEDFAVTYPHSRYARYDSLTPPSTRRRGLMRAGCQEGGGQDTLASFRRLDMELNYMALLQGKYHLHNLELTRPRIFAHSYGSSAANWDILPIGRSGGESGDAKADSTGAKPLPEIHLNRICLTDRPFLVYTDLQDTLAVGLRLERLELREKDRRCILTADAKAFLRTTDYGRLRLPIHLEADATLPEAAPGELGAQIHSLNLQLSALEMNAAGELWRRRDGSLDVDLQASVKDAPMGRLIQEYQDNIPSLKKLKTNAIVSLEAQAKGTYGNGLTPATEARVRIPSAKVNYEGLEARVDLTGSGQDLLGKDPILGLKGTLEAQANPLAGAFIEGMEAAGDLQARLNARARLSQLDMVHIGAASIDCDLTASNLSVRMDSLQAQIPLLTANLATKGNKIDKNIPQGARVLALKANADTLDMSLGDMYIRGGKLDLMLQNSADILKGGKELTPLMGLLKLATLRVKDEEGMSVSLRDNLETFRISPATAQRPSPRLHLRSTSGRLRARLGENLYALREFKFDVAASRHQRRHIRRDSTLRRRRTPLQDDFAGSDIRINLGEGLRSYVRNWDFEGNLNLGSGRVFMPSFPLRTRLSEVKGSFDNDTLDLRSLTLQAGASDLSAQARLTGLRRALLGIGRGRMKLKANVGSNFLDANELLRAYAYHTTYKPKGELSDAALEASVEATELPDSTGNQLIVIPSNLEVDFSLEANGIRYDSLLVSWAAADVAMRNRTLQVTNAVAASNMGDIYFEGFYATRAKDDIKAGFDLNLVDITAEKVITLFPAVDTIMPMLTSFGGDLDCELAATADIDTCMNLVMPSIDGVMRISGADLTLRDSKEFSRLARRLLFRNKGHMRVDNMAVTGMVHNNVLEVFPFVLDVDRFQVAASGTQRLDQAFNYHISVIRSPLLIKFGVNAWGPDFDHIRYGLGRARYRNANVPVYTQQLDTVQYSLVAAIHNIFELGVEKALQENRTGAYLQEMPPEQLAMAPAPEEEISEEALQEKEQEVSQLISTVSERALTRREALKAQVLQLEAKAAQHE